MLRSITFTAVWFDADTLDKQLSVQLSTKYNRQPLCVDNALPDGNDQPARLLVQFLAPPARLQAVHLGLEAVVKANEERVD